MRSNRSLFILCISHLLVVGACERDDDAADAGADGTTTGETSGPSIGTELPDPPQSVEEAVTIYGAAWNETDPETRLALLELVWADDGVYADPTVTATGREDLSEAIAGFQAGFPDATLTLTSDVDHHSRVLRFSWLIDGRSPLPGLDFGEFDDDFRLTRITGFFGPLPQDSPVPPEVAAYVEAWNEPDPDIRLALLSEAMTENAVYHDPTALTVGPEGLSEHIGTYLETAAGTTLALTSTPNAYGQVMRYGWAIETLDERLILGGIDFAELADDGRLSRVVGFFDAP
jgi:hypothetical protein